MVEKENAELRLSCSSFENNASLIVHLSDRPKNRQISGQKLTACLTTDIDPEI